MGLKIGRLTNLVEYIAKDAKGEEKALEAVEGVLKIKPKFKGIRFKEKVEIGDIFEKSGASNPISATREARAAELNATTDMEKITTNLSADQISTQNLAKKTIACGPHPLNNSPEYFESVRKTCLDKEIYKLDKEDRLFEKLLKNMLSHIEYGMDNYNDWNVVRERLGTLLEIPNKVPLTPMNGQQCGDILWGLGDAKITKALEVYGHSFKRGWDIGRVFDAFKNGEDIIIICDQNALVAFMNENIANFSRDNLSKILENISYKNKPLKKMTMVRDLSGKVKHYFNLALDRTPENEKFLDECRDVRKLTEEHLRNAIIVDPSRGIYGKYGSPEVGYLHIDAIRPLDQHLKSLQRDIRLPYDVNLIVGGLNKHISRDALGLLNKDNPELYNEYTQLLIKFNSFEEMKATGKGIELFTFDPFNPEAIYKDKGDNLFRSIWNDRQAPMQDFLISQTREAWRYK